MGKKVAISITIDGDLLRELDSILRGIQEKELKAKKELSTRSSLIELFVRDRIAGKATK